MKRLLLIAALIFGAPSAHAITVDFGGLAEGTLMNGAFDFGSGITGTITTSSLGSKATGDVLVCDTSTSGSECRRKDPDLRSDFSMGSASEVDLGTLDFGNALILEEKTRGSRPNVDDAADGGMITFTFDTALELVSLTILDGGDNGPTGTSLFLDGSLTAFTTDRGGDDNEYDVILVGKYVKSFTVDFSGSGAIGQFTVVPLPASALLLIGGLGSLGALRRMRKRPA